jgi:hypothetical protein
MFVTRKGAAISEGREKTPCFATLSFVGASGVRHPGFASLSKPVPGQRPKHPSEGNVMQEATTGLEFSLEYCTRGKTHNCSQIVGLGVRAKRILGLKNINGKR